jgi:hypothetical protein
VPKLVPYLVGLCGAVFFIAGSLFLYFQVLRGRKQAQAEILGVDVESYETSDENGSVKQYRLRYQVQYTVDGRLFRVPLSGNRGSNTPEEARLRQPGNPVGQRRPVYYRPDKPEDVVIEPLGRRLGVSMLFISVGATILACSALMLYQTPPLDW